MKAAVWTKYGSPEGLQIKEVEKPVPQDHEVLIKIHATTVTAGDCEMRSLKLALGLGFLMRMYNGIKAPRRITILGQELAGEIEAVGRDVQSFKVGDQVFAATDAGLGAYAQYICLPEISKEVMLALKPSNLTFEQAATVPVGGLEALHFLRRVNPRKGQKILINGAGGSIGTFAIQLAKHFGAEVTAVDSTRKLDMMHSIGADHVIDYTREDFTRYSYTYDVIFDVVGRAPFYRSKRSLNKQGFFLIANPKFSKMIRGRWTSLTSSKRVIFWTLGRKVEALHHLRELIEADKIMPVIDRQYPLEQIAEAHRYVESGQKSGSVVITVDQQTT